MTAEMPLLPNRFICTPIKHIEIDDSVVSLNIKNIKQHITTMYILCIKDDYKIPLLGGVPYGLSSVASRTEIILIVKIKIIENEVFGDWFSDLSKKYEAQKIKNNI